MRENNEEKSNITSVTEKELELLGRHLDVLMVVKEKGPIGIIKLSQITRQPQHMIRYSLRSLEKCGLITPSPNGASVTDLINQTLDTIDKSLDNINDTVMILKKKLNKK